MRLGRLLTPEPRRRPRPPVSIDLEHGIPAWLLRGLSAAVVLVLTPVLNDPVVLLLCALAVAFLPHQGTAAVLLLLGAGYVWSQPPTFLLCALIVLVLHAVTVLMRLTAPLPPSGRVERLLVLRALGSFVVIQLIAQAMVGFSFAAMSAMPTVTWFAVLAVAGIGAAVVAGARWVGRHTQ